MRKRFELLAVDVPKLQIAARLRHFKASFHGLGNYPPNLNQRAARRFDIMFCLEFSGYQHLEIDLGQLDVQDLIEQGAAIAVDYFHGEYVKEDTHAAKLVRKSKENKSLSWFDVYRDGLFFSLIAKQASCEKMLVDWIEPWLPFDESHYFVTVHDNSYHKLLAEFIKHGELVSDDLVAELNNCKRTRPSLLFACLNAIIHRDDKDLGRNLAKLLNSFFKSEFNKGSGSHFAIEASILWHIAQRIGLTPKGPNEKQVALIMTRETLGLAA